jgi:hypothetical protein
MMVKWIMIFIVALALNLGLLCLAGQSGKARDELMDTWQALRTAILAHDVESVSAVARFPLKSLDYSYDKIESAADLKERFAVIFEPKLLEILGNDEDCVLQIDPGYEVDCANGYMIFGFESHDGEYRLAYLGSINE